MAEFRLDIIGDTEDLTSALTEASKVLTELGDDAIETGKKTQAAFSNTGGVEKFDKSLKSQVLTLAKLETEMKKLIAAKSKAFDGKEAAALDIQLKNVGKSLQNLDASLAKADGTAKSFKAQIRENKDILAQMQEQGLDTTETFEALTIATAKLERQVDNTNERIKFLASDTKNLDGLIGILRGVTGGFAFAQGAAALFGSENENIQKGLLKVNAAMAILTGLQEIQQALQKSSAAYITIENILRKGKILLIGAEAIATEGLTKAQYASAVAAKALRAALIATGIGAIVVLVATLVSKMIEWTGATEDQKNALKELNDELKVTEEFSNIVTDLIDKNTQKQILKAKQLGSNNETIRQLEAEGRKKTITELDKHYNELLTKQENFDAKKFDTVENAKQALEALDNATAAAGTKLQAAIADDEIAIEQAKLDSINEIRAANDKFEDEEKAKAAKRVKDLQDIQDANNANRIAAMREGLDKELALLDEARRKELRDGKKQGLDLTLIEAKFAKERSDIILKYGKINLGLQGSFQDAQTREFYKHQLQLLDSAEQVALLELEIEKQTGDKTIAQTREIENKKLEIMIEAAEKRLEILKKTGGDPVEIKKLELALTNLRKSFDFDGGLFESLNITSDQAAEIQQNFQILTDNLKNLLSGFVEESIADNQAIISSLDEQIEKTKDNIEKQQDLAAEGRSNDLQAEQDKLDKLEAQRRQAIERDKKLQKDKLNIDAAVQLSSLITASAQIFQAYASLPFVGQALAIAAIATMFAAFATAQVRARENIKTQEFGEGGWIDGKPHSEGGVKYYSDDSTVEVEGGEYVTRKKQARKYAALLEAINKDKIKSMDISELLQHTGVSLSESAIENYRSAVKAQDDADIVRQYQIFANSPDLKGFREDFNAFVEYQKGKDSVIAADGYLITKKGNRTTRIKQ